ncbi:Ca-activated chloride channel family protein [Nannocystis exedens]|uniref:Ca-activated chloride channel family protein n=1 Tax=Nannocystis exedens TaxID=54 RepID=A0A1I1XLG6_9BACT|nr:VWA domain-containing protein [Nannocystis exedens]PCC73327.1 aerotolerance-related membrane protein [Nannocystis exedens]SFE08187.1 Ca-activated chloride channel family protein [Nannocystis exedens]
MSASAKRLVAVLHNLLPILGFAGLAVALSLLGLVAYLGADLRHVVIASPWWLLAALVPLLAVVIRGVVSPRPATLKFSRATSARRLGPGLAARLAHLPDGLRLAAAILLALALARPESSRTTDRVEHKGIDIVVALDLSDSMEADDLYPNRLEAAKDVIDSFIARRRHDRVGMVAFGATATTVSPLTVDHGVLRQLVRRLQLGSIDGSKTAIGAGLGQALNRLKESDADSKVVVLLTDGVHNAEGVDPDSMAREAADRGVHVYTILIGRQAASIDPGRLERIASTTGGYAYTAVDQQALVTTFQDLLNKLDRSTILGEHIRAQLFHLVLWPALLLLMLDIVLRSTRLRRFP